MLGVGLKDNKPAHYKITFQGLATSLKDILQDDGLKDLDYSGLHFANTIYNRFSGVRDGLYLNGGTTPEQDSDGNNLHPDVIYAPIFTKGKVVALPYQPSINTSNDNSYASTKADFTLAKFTGIGPTNTLVEDAGPFKNAPVTINDYKPSVKVGRIIKMINDKYNLKFSTEFCQLEEIDQMYIHYNGKKEESKVENGSSAFN